MSWGVPAIPVTNAIEASIYSSDVFMELEPVATGLAKVTGSDFLAGVADTVVRQPTAPGEFTNPAAQIRSFVVTRLPRSTERFLTDTNIAAASIGVVRLLNGDFNVGDSGIFALASGGDEIRSVVHFDRLTDERWSCPPRNNQLYEGPDGLITLL